MIVPQFEYDVAFSFAGEDREIVEYVAANLRKNYRVFYDEYETAQLWGADLSETLPLKYTQSRYCVIIQSPAYLSKLWTVLERQAIVFEFLRRRGKDYILPLRISTQDCDIPGLSGLIGYRRVSEKEEWPQIVDLIRTKLSVDPIV
jgi:hypothetical protein